MATCPSLDVDNLASCQNRMNRQHVILASISFPVDSSRDIVYSIVDIRHSHLEMHIKTKRSTTSAILVRSV